MSALKHFGCITFHDIFQAFSTFPVGVGRGAAMGRCGSETSMRDMCGGIRRAEKV